MHFELLAQSTYQQHWLVLLGFCQLGGDALPSWIVKHWTRDRCCNWFGFDMSDEVCSGNPDIKPNRVNPWLRNRNRNRNRNKGRRGRARFRSDVSALLLPPRTRVFVALLPLHTQRRPCRLRVWILGGSAGDYRVIASRISSSLFLLSCGSPWSNLLPDF
ncbi:hypothetical protein J3F83DRAFT_96293 [Trichoderma novae-zelandiae]